MVACERVQQRCGLLGKARVGILSEGGGLRAGQCRFEQADIADLRRGAERPLRDVEQRVEVEEDHWPRRSRASA